MKLQTPRFGELEVTEADLISFPDGLPGFQGKRYVLFHKEEAPAIDWLQSVDEPEVALMTIDPAELGLDYRPEPKAAELAPLGADPDGSLEVRVILRPAEDAPGKLRVNLFAPLFFNPVNRLGIQIPLVGSGYEVSALWPPEPTEPPADS
ncbi:MAG TPA: flagellar assembly protein FliW [Myxococcales bacterium LLY-WYZ-16_1]|jgi:flagellar assembly factor FliW|nr:flagellar assembly protein FliW [Myxococcales bacterium LLY-WYZ-16_1]